MLNEEIPREWSWEILEQYLEEWWAHNQRFVFNKGDDVYAEFKDDLQCNIHRWYDRTNIHALLEIVNKTTTQYFSAQGADKERSNTTSYFRESLVEVLQRAREPAKDGGISDLERIMKLLKGDKIGSHAAHLIFRGFEEAEDSKPGRDLFHTLGVLPAIDPETIQFGCAEWFWNRQVNSYALQVEPIRHKTKDRVYVDYQEALHIEQVTNQFFAQIRNLL